MSGAANNAFFAGQISLRYEYKDSRARLMTASNVLQGYGGGKK